MEEILSRFVSDLIGRLTGPLTMRLFLQPSVAAFFAVRDGLKDARDGRPYHFWRMVTGPPEARMRRAKETWKAVSKVFIMAVVLDLVYQWLALPSIYPIESMVTATILAIVPYVALRGVANRVVRSWMARHARQSGTMICLITALAFGVTDALAQSQDKPKDPPKLGWSNDTDLSLVLTAGNSAAQTWGFTDKLRYVWKDARVEFEVNVVRANKSEDRFFMVAPGLEFPVGGAPAAPATSLVEPDPTLDVANSLVRGSYERNITPRFFWNAGGSWDRNDDAGIENRYIAFFGVGHKWVDSERRRVTTSYGLSYTDREEEDPDPEKDRRFAGGRVGWDYMEQLNAGTKFDHTFRTNLNLSDPADYSMTTTSAVSVSVVSHVSLKVSLQWLFENEPALESDLDVIAFVEVINPDGVPGSGDERFRTLSSGGSKLVIGSADARKDKLDTIFKTALVINF
jgi:hypothetical protein